MQGKFGVLGILDDWEKGDIRGDQMVNIILNSHSSIRKGIICISPQLASDREVDEVVDQLIRDLESVRKEAKKNIRSMNTRMRNS